MSKRSQFEEHFLPLLRKNNILSSFFRIAEAQKLLSDSSLSITEIATAVGYYRADYFTHSFKQRLSVSPREYRKALTSPSASDTIP